jgi:hypothetical protein
MTRGRLLAGVGGYGGYWRLWAAPALPAPAGAARPAKSSLDECAVSTVDLATPWVAESEFTARGVASVEKAARGALDAP